MNCKKARELILTDYIDGELKPELRKEIEGHLHLCKGCRKLLCDLQESAVKPFKQLEELVPPEAVWDNIREAIREKEENVFSLSDWFRQVLGRISYIPRPAFAVTMATAVIVMGVFFWWRSSYMSRNGMIDCFVDQASFFSDSSGDGEALDLGTDIEDFFL